MQAGSVVVTETGLERSSFAEFDPRPLFGLTGRRVHAKEKHLHALLARNFHKLDRIVRRDIEVQLTQVRTDLQRTNQKTVDCNPQFLWLMLARLTQAMSKLDREIVRTPAGCATTAGVPGRPFRLG